MHFAKLPPKAFLAVSTATGSASVGVVAFLQGHLLFSSFKCLVI